MATIKVKVSELNNEFLESIKSLFGNNKDAELTITYNNKQLIYLDKLRKSKQQLEDGKNLVTFTIDELENDTNKKKTI